MLSRFHYKNFEPSFGARHCAEGVLDRLEDAAPYSSTVMGAVESVSDAFWVSVDIYSRYGMFSASSHDSNLERALLAVEEKMRSKLDQWKKSRFVEVKERISELTKKEGEPVATA